MEDDIMRTIEQIAKEAAHYQTKVWRGHDEKDKEEFIEGAFGLYSVLTDATPLLKTRAAEKLQQAYWKSYEAETYQKLEYFGEEDECYDSARELIEMSRALVGLEIKSPQFTKRWWKAYRHRDEPAVLDNLVKEHLCQITGTNNLNAARRCASILLEASKYHETKDWRLVENKLVEYFDVYLSNLPKRVMMRAPTG
jgi:hypothetical protein